MTFLRKKYFQAVSCVAILMSLPAPGFAETYTFEPVVEGLDTPWAFGFLPGGGILITERDGKLLLFSGTRRVEIAGLPDIKADGQGGLLDILIPRDFATSREVYLTYVTKQGWRGSGTALFRGVLSEDGARLTQGKTIFEMSKTGTGGRHFGSRIVEGQDGTIYMTIGDRGDDESAQDRASHNGSVLRLSREGQPLASNPFTKDSAFLPEIFSYGHRNPQGLAIDGQGQVWAVEHGARGGDEVNLIQPGANYGWPVISYGTHYSGAKIGEGTAKAGLEQPKFYWDPSIAPSGIAIHDGRGNPEWKGDMFVGSLKYDYIARLEGAPLREVEQISGPETERVRDVRQGPDGAIWFLSVGQGALYKIAQ